MSETPFRQYDSFDGLDALIEALIERVDVQDARMRVLSDRINKLEGIAPEPDRNGWTTIQRAAHMTGYSVSGLRKQIAAHKVRAQRRGGRWLVDPTSLIARVR